MAGLLRKLVLLAIAAALWVAEGRLEEGVDARRLDSIQVELLVPNAERKDLLVAMVSLRRGDGAVFEYLRTQGYWRCRQAFGALGDAGEVQQLVDAVLLAEGSTQSDVPARAAAYGFDTERMWTVTLHGVKALEQPDGDVLLRLELGDSLPSLGGSFVRKLSKQPDAAPPSVVLAIDTDPRALLDVSGQAPPLLDDKLVPDGWPGQAARLERIELQRASGDSFELSLVERDLDPALLAAGASPVEWQLTRPDGSQAVTSPDHAIAYSVFTRLAPWAGIFSPEQLEALIGEDVSARLVLVPSRGETIVLVMGKPREDGSVPVVNGLTRLLLLLSPEVAGLLLPSSEALLTAAAENPWEPWLTRAATPPLPR